MAIDLDNAPEELTAIQKALGLNACVVIHRPSTAAADRYFTAQENTDAGRMAVLGNAIASVNEGDVVELLGGDFAVEDGEPLSSFTAETGWTVVFSNGAGLLYENEEDPRHDAHLFPGTDRYGVNFGVRPLAPGITTYVDMQPRIMAALYSMPAVGNAVEMPPGYSNFATRKGTLFLENGSHGQLSTIYTSGYQQITCVGGRNAALVQMEGFAPATEGFTPGQEDANEIFQIRVMRGYVGEELASNFHFDVRFSNLQFFNSSPLNTQGSAILYSGGQGSKLTNISYAGMGSRGIVVQSGSTYFEIDDLTCVGDDTGVVGIRQTGPMLQINQCDSFSIGMISLVNLNSEADDTDPDGTRRNYTYNGNTFVLPGVLIDNSYGFTINQINGEMIASAARIQNSRNFKIGVMAARANNKIHVGEILLSLKGCINYSVGGLEGAYFEKLYEALDPQNAFEDHFVAEGGDEEAFQTCPGISHSQRSYLHSEAASLSTPVLDLNQGSAAEPVLAKSWKWQAGGSQENTLGVFYSVSAANVAYNHILTQSVGGDAGQMPETYTIALDSDGGGGVHIPSKLNVVGAVNAGTLNAGATIFTLAPIAGSATQTNINAFASAGLSINGTLGATGQTAITFSSGGGGGAAIALGRGTSWDTFLAFYTNASGSAGSGVMTERMRIFENGNVTIGSTSNFYRLDITNLALTSATSAVPLGNIITALSSNGVGAPVTLKFTDTTTTNAYIGMLNGNLYFGANTLTPQMSLSTLGNLDVIGKVKALIPNYADDAAADADAGLLSGQLYRTTAGARTVFQKP